MEISNTSNAQLREIYLFEKSLADKLKQTGADRKNLYQEVYREYYEKFPHHPFIEQDINKAALQAVKKQLNVLSHFLGEDDVFAEIGSGTGALSFEVAKQVKSVTLIDVSDAPTKSASFPENARLVLSNGVNMPGELSNMDIVYSNQLMEHLHHDDADEQLNDIFSALKYGGKYVCITPHKYTGPHDISRYFDDEATCFHLKEYTVTELIRMFDEVGFRTVKYYIMPKSVLIQLPKVLVRIIEFLLSQLSPYSRKKIGVKLPFRSLFNFVLVGVK